MRAKKVLSETELQCRKEEAEKRQQRRDNVKLSMRAARETAKTQKALHFDLRKAPTLEWLLAIDRVRAEHGEVFVAVSGPSLIVHSKQIEGAVQTGRYDVRALLGDVGADVLHGVTERAA